MLARPLGTKQDRPKPARADRRNPDYNEPMTGGDDMQPASTGVRLTYDDFLLFPDDGLRHELIDGEHYVSPSPNTKHQRLSGNLYFLIRSYLEIHPIGEVLYAPFDVVFSFFDIVVPDLIYLSKERASTVITPLNAQGAPELIVEIGSKSTRKRDETIKRALYERSGVSEYWMVDPNAHAVRICRLGDSRFGRERVLRLENGDVVTTPLLPNLELRLRDIFKD